MNDTILNLLSAPWKISVIFTAVRLRLFTILSNRPMTIKELSSHCDAHPHLLEPLVNACISMALIKRNRGKYINSHFSQVYFVEGNIQYIGDFIKLQYNESAQWNKLYDIIKKSNKKYENTQTSENVHRTFIKGMHNIGNLGEAEVLKNCVDLSGCKIMVDAGGGSGLYSIVLCQRYPELQSIILDSKETLIITKEIISSYKEKGRITLREADITKESYGENIDVVLLSDVIYDELTADLVLRNAWESLHQNGILLIRGYYSDPEKTDSLFGALFVLNQIVFDPNRKVLTISSLEKMVSKNGFSILKRSPLTEQSFILISEKR